MMTRAISLLRIAPGVARCFAQRANERLFMAMGKAIKPSASNHPVSSAGAPGAVTPSKRRKSSTAAHEATPPDAVLVAKAQRIRQQLAELYPSPSIPLGHTSHFQLLVAVMLSAQVSVGCGKLGSKQCCSSYSLAVYPFHHRCASLPRPYLIPFL